MVVFLTGHQCTKLAWSMCMCISEYFQTLPVNINSDMHEYRTGFRSSLHMNRATREYAKRCLSYSIPIAINNTKPIITEKVHTHSLKGFSNYVKNSCIQGYRMTCDKRDCYICKKNGPPTVIYLDEWHYITWHYACNNQTTILYWYHYSYRYNIYK